MAKSTSADTVSEESGAPVEEMSYTDASAELDGIVEFFEQREVDVDQLVGRLVRATAIIEELDKRLRHTRVQVEQLLPRLGSALDDAAPSGETSAGETSAGAGELPGGGAPRGKSTTGGVPPGPEQGLF